MRPITEVEPPDIGGLKENEMQTTEIADLAAALAKAQAQVEGAKKDSTNPHFKSAYADLEAVWAACRKPLTDNGLCIHQRCCRDDDGQSKLVTRILHSSGQWIEDGGIPLLVDKGSMQGLGSALTYARRYGLMAAVGIAPEDDDGNAAGNPAMKAKKKEEMWHGPLGKTALRMEAQKIATEIRSCTDRDQLLAFWGSEETMAILEQCKKDLEGKYFYGTDNADGLKAVFEKKEAELAEQSYAPGELTDDQTPIGAG